MKQVKVFDEAFADKLKRLRKARGFSLQRMSDMTGVSPSYISRLERNEKQSPSFPILVELARALKVDVLTLAEGLVEQDEVVDLYSLMFKSPLRVADKILTEEETRQVIHLIERIAKFDWNEQTMWRELCEVGNLISAFKGRHDVEPRT
ncbi:helix-turn-helix domain-containing protein [Lysinibacillus sp. K60]|uniref:helix-turn-helix domain-containing protein n=1 Tax=Lysinibacillus sp. K60 TaxID=2720027 RepID=UPI001C8B8827|nr:helix-turn-helix transcriptional regulator [Lysinibacillus sp. K60]MBX8944788.1 helix-turn-helix transcriptional regulator [Lysinibacillus sp. K60]